MSENDRPHITCWILHGTPAGFKSNATKDDPAEFRAYANFHKGEDTHIDHPSNPGEKFIKETLDSGDIAYTFVRTGIYQETSDRDGSNYVALTVFIPGNVRISNEKHFEQELKQILETNVLDKYTYPHDNSRKWVQNAQFALFDRHEVDDEIGDLIEQRLYKYLSTNEPIRVKKATPNVYVDGAEKLQQEIAGLQEIQSAIVTAIARKQAELERLTNHQ